MQTKHMLHTLTISLSNWKFQTCDLIINLNKTTNTVAQQRLTANGRVL